MPLPVNLGSVNIRGAGLSLRAPYFERLAQDQCGVPWLEVVADQFLGHQGLLLERLLQLRRRYPMVLHSVGLSLGSCDPLNQTYLTQLKTLADQIKPLWVSDHLAWVSYQGEYVYDLLPLPYTEAVAAYVATRIQSVREALGYPFLIENISSYLTYRDSDCTEAVFLNTVAEYADCGILLDVNNLYVNAQNHHFDMTTYLEALSPHRVQQIHLAGYEVQGDILVDTHAHTVYPAVWTLYQQVISRFGPIPTCIEWDSALPTWTVLNEERLKAEQFLSMEVPL